MPLADADETTQTSSWTRFQVMRYHLVNQSLQVLPPLLISGAHS